MLSPKQAAFIRDPATVKIAHGSIRSAKTTAEIIDWLRWVPTAPPGPLAVVGKTRDTIGRNVLDVIEQLDHRAIKWRAGAPTCRIMGRLHHVLGANDAQAESKVRGLTLAGALVDEVTLLTEDLFTTLLGRLSVDGARLLGTTNPDNPGHWLKKKYLDRAAELGWSVWHFTMADNPGLSAEYVARVSREYTGVYHLRFVKGLWVAAEGAIYDAWDERAMVIPWAALPPLVRYVGVGIDYGTTNPSSAILLGQDVLGTYYFVDEWRHDPSQTGRRLTDEELSRELKAWLLRPHHPGVDADGDPVHEPLIGTLAVDPAAASFKVQLTRDGLPVSDADNDVDYGIRQLSSALAAGRLKVTDRCTGFIAEAPGYRWDPKASAKGEDKPVKENDHSLDAARYAFMLTDPDHQQQHSTTGVTDLS